MGVDSTLERGPTVSSRLFDRLRTVSECLRRVELPGGEACLLYRRGDGGFEVGELKEHILVGRDQGADFRIENRRVSREHLRIRQTGETFLLEDVGSLNGTWVNGERICRRELRDGDILEFGGEVLVFCGPVEPSDSAMSGNPPRPQRNR